LGEARLLGFYATFEKVSSVAVPIVVGLLAAGFGYSGSLGAIGVLTLAGVALFALTARNLRGDGR
jgi:MFS-type transporter involved in bile tolerance (Atg22 family)